MKRMLVCLLIFVLLTGCTLRNRQDSRNFIPENRSKETKASVHRQSGGEEPVIVSSPVKEIKHLEGTCTYGGETVSYSYRLPYLDLSGSYAAGCNGEIETGFGEPIRAAEKAMEDRGLPEVSRVGYETWQYDQVLCLLVYRVETRGGERHESLYTVNASTGSAVTADEVLTAAGVTRETFRKGLDDAVREFYADSFGPYYEPDDFRYTEGKNKTLAVLDKAEPVSLTEQGIPVAAVTVIDPTGVATTARIPVPAP